MLSKNTKCICIYPKGTFWCQDTFYSFHVARQKASFRGWLPFRDVKRLLDLTLQILHDFKRLRDCQLLLSVLSCCFLYIYAVLCMFLLLWSCILWQQLTKYLFDLYFWSCNSKMDQRGMIVLAGNSHPELARAVTK